MTELTDSIKPIYMGYCKDERKYYFYFIKDKVPRFLNYVTYFFWGKGPPGTLELVPVPEAIEVEMQQFLNGVLHYEFRKQRKNSKSESAVRIFRNPQDVTPAGEEDGNTEVQCFGGKPRKPTSGTIPGDNPSPSGISRGILESSERVQLKQKRHRRTKAEMLAAREPKKLPAKPVVEIAVVQKVTKDVKAKKRKSTPSKSTS